MYWLGRYLDPVTLTYILRSSAFYTFYVNVQYLLNYKAYNHQTLHSASPQCTDSAGTLTWWPWPIFHAPLTFTPFTSPFHMSSTVRPSTTKPYIALLQGWLGGAKVLCILHHWGVQLILAYSWARPAILVVGKGRGGMFLFLLFLHFHSCSSFFPVPLFHLLYSLFYLFSPFLWEMTQNDPQGLTCR